MADGMDTGERTKGENDMGWESRGCAESGEDGAMASKAGEGKARREHMHIQGAPCR